jgi:hypothetical protein
MEHGPAWEHNRDLRSETGVASGGRNHDGPMRTRSIAALRIARSLAIAVFRPLLPHSRPTMPRSAPLNLRIGLAAGEDT